MGKHPKSQYKYVGFVWTGVVNSFLAHGFKTGHEAALWMEKMKDEEPQMFEVGREVGTSLTSVVFPKEVDNEFESR